MKTFVILMTILGLFIVTAQPGPVPKSNLTPMQYAALTSTGTIAIQFNSEWNKANELKWVETPKCKYYRVDLDKEPSYKEKLGIKSLPTLIVYKNGKEIKRYEGGLHMKITTPIHIIQKDL